MTRYLLGQLPEAERDVCEQEWFIDKARYYELCEVENALIDDYVRGALRENERTLFERHFLTIPARRDRVLTARALLQTIDTPIDKVESPWRRWLTGWRVPQLIPALALVVLLLVGGMWMYRQQRVLQAQLAQATTATAEQQHRAQELEQSLASERAANARLTAELTRRTAAALPPSTSVPMPTTLFFVLTDGVLRSEGGAALPTLQLAKGIERVQLQVTLSAHEYKQFTATLHTAEGRDIQRWTVKAAGTRLALALAAQQLKPGDYVLMIYGIKADRTADEFRRVPFKVNAP